MRLQVGRVPYCGVSLPCLNIVPVCWLLWCGLFPSDRNIVTSFSHGFGHLPWFTCGCWLVCFGVWWKRDEWCSCHCAVQVGVASLGYWHTKVLGSVVLFIPKHDITHWRTVYPTAEIPNLCDQTVKQLPSCRLGYFSSRQTGVSTVCWWG